MRTSLLVSSLVSSSLVAGQPQQPEMDFGAWSSKFGKSYGAEERASRAAVFASNAQVVSELSAASPGAVFSLDTPFADLTEEEFAKAALMPPRAAPRLAPERRLPALNASAAPSSFDWRNHNAVSSVKDQGALGTCWAFSAIGNIEGQLAIKSGAAPVSLSVEQLLECDNSTHPTNSSGEPVGGDCGEFGGWPYLAFGYFERAGGVLTDADMPYCAGIPLGKPGNCEPCMAAGYDKKTCGNHGRRLQGLQSKDDDLYDDDGQVPLYCNKSTTKGQGPFDYCGAGAAKAGFAAHVADWKAIGTDEEQIAAALAGGGSADGAAAFGGGPLSIALNAGPLQFYKKGVFSPGGLFKCDPKKLDHGVLLVGYGTDAGKDYWTVKNSWGATWGESGYFRLERGVGACGVNAQVVTALLA